MTDMLDTAVLTQKAADLVAAARRHGADAADAVVVRGTSLSTDVRLGKVEETDRSERNDFALRVFVGGRNASISANIFADVDALAERAVAMARVAPEDPFAGLADADRLAKDFADLDLLDATEPTAADLVSRAREVEDAARAVAGVTNSGGASASWSLGGLVLVTSTGFSGSYLVSRHGLSVSAIAGTGTGMERDWEASSRVYLSDLDAPSAIGRKAGERAVARLNPRQTETGPTTVIWDPRASTSFLGHLAGATNGAAIARKSSFLLGHLGKPVFAPGVRITDDPSRKRGLASRPFDGDGLAGSAFDVVTDGVLQTWFLDTASARELGLSSNGRAARGAGSPSPSSTNLTMLAGTTTRTDMLKSVKSGLYVTDMIGSGVNGVTGDYSRGASGFWIENGELTYAVSEITVAGNLIDMFARLVPADDLEYRFATNAPSVMIEGLTVAGR